MEQVKSVPPEVPRYNEVGTRSGRVVLCAAGQSTLEMLPLIKKRKADGIPVCAVKGVANVLIENGVVPDYAVFMDSQENQTRFFDNPHPDVTYYIASNCHPKVFEALKGFKVIQWHASSIELLKAGGFKGYYITGGRTTGLRSVNLMRSMGFDTLEMFGYDCCFRERSHIYDKPKYARTVMALVGEREFTTTLDMMGQHEDFLRILERAPETKFIVMGNGMIVHALKEFVLQKSKPCPWYFLPAFSVDDLDERGNLKENAA